MIPWLIFWSHGQWIVDSSPSADHNCRDFVMTWHDVTCHVSHVCLRLSQWATSLVWITESHEQMREPSGAVQRLSISPPGQESQKPWRRSTQSHGQNPYHLVLVDSNWCMGSPSRHLGIASACTCHGAWSSTPVFRVAFPLFTSGSMVVRFSGIFFCRKSFRAVSTSGLQNSLMSPNKCTGLQGPFKSSAWQAALYSTAEWCWGGSTSTLSFEDNMAARVFTATPAVMADLCWD